uniref:Putative secreted protein n=1 Tax=Anopheles darlingi TaxID=43151 RepID=A0A2M4DED5_ANODA
MRMRCDAVHHWVTLATHRSDQQLLVLLLLLLLLLHCSSYGPGIIDNLLATEPPIPCAQKKNSNSNSKESEKKNDSETKNASSPSPPRGSWVAAQHNYWSRETH